MTFEELAEAFVAACFRAEREVPETVAVAVRGAAEATMAMLDMTLIEERRMAFEPT